MTASGKENYSNNELLSGQSGKNSLLANRARRLHVILLRIIMIYSVVFFFINILIQQIEQAYITLAIFPGTLFALWLNKKGEYYYSKIWNATQICVALFLISKYSNENTFPSAFFIPLIMGTLITFQGTDKKTGYVMSAIFFVMMMWLQFIPGRAYSFQQTSNISIIVERCFNVIGSALLIVLQAVYLIRVNDMVQDKLFSQSEELLRKNDQLKVSVFTRDKMMSVLSHDLRSPLALLYSGMDVLHPGKLSPQVQEKMVEQFKQRTAQTLELVDNILLWSRVQRDNVFYMPTAVPLKNIYAFIGEYCDIIRPGKKIDYSLLLEEKDNIRILGDRDMIEAILRNLISNAYKFTREGGEIIIKADACESGWCFDVSDSGTGMTPEQVAMINNSVAFTTQGTNQEKGSGLGIQLVQDFLSHHNSRLKVVSEAGKGTQFSFSLPLV